MELKLDKVIWPVIMSTKPYGPFNSAECSPSKTSKVSVRT